MSKIKIPPDELQNKINNEIANSNALDGDCRKCRVRSVVPSTNQHCNWDIKYTNEACTSECRTVLKAILHKVANNYDALWDK